MTLDWSWPGCWSLAPIIEKCGPQRTAEEIFLEIVRRRGSVAGLARIGREHSSCVKARMDQLQGVGVPSSKHRKMISCSTISPLSLLPCRHALSRRCGKKPAAASQVKRTEESAASRGPSCPKLTQALLLRERIKNDLAENGMTDHDVRELELEALESQDLQYDLWMFEANS